MRSQRRQLQDAASPLASRRSAWRFTTRRLLILSTLLAIVFAFAGGLKAPLYFQIGAALYLAVHVIWFVMRWPGFRENWRDNQKLRLESIHRERELAIEAARSAKYQLGDSTAPDVDGS